MNKIPEVLEQKPTKIERINERIKIMKDPCLTCDYIWNFDDGIKGIHIKIHSELQNKSTYEWDKNEEWMWYVQIANSKKNLENEKYIESVSTRSFNEAILYANEYAKNITDIDLKKCVSA